MAYTRRYAPPSQRRWPIRTLVVAVLAAVVAVSTYRSLARAVAARSFELTTAKDALRQAQEKAKTYERSLIDMKRIETSLSAQNEELSELKKELEATREREREAVKRAEESARAAAVAKAEAKNAKEEQLLNDGVRAKSMPSDGIELEVESAFGAESKTGSARTSASAGGDTGDESDPMLVAATLDLTQGGSDGSNARDFAASAGDDEVLAMSKAKSDSVASDVKVKVLDSASGSDPLLRNLAAPPPSAMGEVEMKCNGKENSEYWGAVVQDGSTNPQPDAAACCESCAKMNANGANKCSVWVYGTKNKQCWLKYESSPELASPANEGPHIEWTSGYFILPKHTTKPKYEKATGKKNIPKCLHTIMTSNGNVYMNWQSRVMYASYLKHASTEGSIMKAFTRILHKGRHDELMHEIPTMRFNPVQSKCDGWCDYPVADRSQAVAQWLETADSERCSHVVMVETDHIIVKTPSPSILLPQGEAMGFRFGYMNPVHAILKQNYPQYFQGGKTMPPTGNAPSVVNTVDLRKIAPLWARFVNETEEPEAVRKELGWVRDMYAYDLAALASGIEHRLAVNPESLLMAQPPADSQLGNAFILHYTWGSEIYDKNDKFLWKWDKRAYGEGQYGQGPYILTEIPLPPEWDESVGLQLQTFFQPRLLTPSRLGLIKLLITEFNDAVRLLPKIPKGYKTIEEARIDV